MWWAIAIIGYLIIGKAVINVCENSCWIDCENSMETLAAIIFFPIVILWLIIETIGDIISELFL